MRSSKIKVYSERLKREFFTDLFISDRKPKFLVLYFGGSGVDGQTYADSGKTIIPVFDSSFLRLDKKMGFAFSYIPSPQAQISIGIEN